MVAKLVILLLTGLVKSLSGQNILTNDSLSAQKYHLLALVIASCFKKWLMSKMPFNISSDLCFDIKLLDIDLAWVSCHQRLGERRSALPLFRFHLSAFPPETPNTQVNIDLIHGTCHLCTHFKIDRIKAICMFYIFQGGKQVIKFANVSDCGRVC